MSRRSGRVYSRITAPIVTTQLRPTTTTVFDVWIQQTTPRRSDKIDNANRSNNKTVANSRFGRGTNQNQQTMEFTLLTADEMFILTFPAMTQIDRVITDDIFETINFCEN